MVLAARKEHILLGQVSLIVILHFLSTTGMFASLLKAVQRLLLKEAFQFIFVLTTMVQFISY